MNRVIGQFLHEQMFSFPSIIMIYMNKQYFPYKQSYCSNHEIIVESIGVSSNVSDDDVEAFSTVVESDIKQACNSVCTAARPVEDDGEAPGIVVEAMKVSSDIKKAWTSSRLMKKGPSVQCICSHTTKSIDEETSATVVESIRVSSGIERRSTRPGGEAFGMVVVAVSVSSDIRKASTSLAKNASSVQFCSPPRSTDDEDEAKNASSSSVVIGSSPPPTSVDDGEAAATPASFGATESTEER